MFIFCVKFMLFLVRESGTDLLYIDPDRAIQIWAPAGGIRSVKNCYVAKWVFETV